jgi:hypothetical protein
MDASRTTTEVIQEHLGYRLRGDLEKDLRNYAGGVVMLTGSGRAGTTVTKACVPRRPN